MAASVGPSASATSLGNTDRSKYRKSRCPRSRIRSSRTGIGLDGSEIFSITGLSDAIHPGQMVTLEITRKDGAPQSVPVKLRIDTAIEIDYYRHGGILPFVLRELMARG